MPFINKICLILLLTFLKIYNNVFFIMKQELTEHELSSYNVSENTKLWKEYNKDYIKILSTGQIIRKENAKKFLDKLVEENFLELL